MSLPQPPSASSVPETSPRGPVRRFLRKALRNWLERHQHPFNFAIHLLGIPLAVAGVVVLFWQPWWGLGLLVFGYALQYVGHAVEGNDLGEWAGIKRMLGLPYVGIAPRWQKAANHDSALPAPK